MPAVPLIDRYVTCEDAFDVVMDFIVLAIKSLLVKFHTKRIDQRVDMAPAPRSSRRFQR